MQIPILNGIYADDNADFRQQYPHNLMPVAINSGISSGYLRPAWGVTQTASSNDSGPDRAGVYYKNKHIRVQGTCLYVVAEDGYQDLIDCFEIYAPSGNGHVGTANSFDYLALADSGNLYLWDETNSGAELIHVTDSDLGFVKDVVFIDGYFMTTDGQFLVVTDLGDPTSVNNLKYGSAEIDPDPIVGLIVVNNQVFALGRYTIEAFYNKGGALFPFARIDGSRMNRGLIGTYAKCQIDNVIYFLGSGKNEPPAIWAGANADTQKISTREIDEILRTYDESTLERVVFERIVDRQSSQIWVRLPDKILVYDQALSVQIKTPIWFTMDKGPLNACWVNKKWYVGNESGGVGYLDLSTSLVFGSGREWRFQTVAKYEDSRGAVINELELVGLPGRITLGIDPTIWTSYSLDGVTFSQEWAIKTGKQGDRTKRMVWFKQGFMKNYRIQRFRGNSDAHISFARLEAQTQRMAY